MTTDNICFYLQNRLIQTSQTGGLWYSDTSPFSIPCLRPQQGKLLQAMSQGAQYVMGENLEIVWAQFSTLS
jgi:hypothetical protein